MTPTLHSIAEWTEDLAILDIADIVRREGHRIYRMTKDGDYQSSLCGMTVTYNGCGNVVALKSHDLDLCISIEEQPADSSDGIERYAGKKKLTPSYRQGNGFILVVWHKHLSAYRRVMRPMRDMPVTTAA